MYQTYLDQRFKELQGNLPTIGKEFMDGSGWVEDEEGTNQDLLDEGFWEEESLNVIDLLDQPQEDLGSNLDILTYELTFRTKD